MKGRKHIKTAFYIRKTGINYTLNGDYYLPDLALTFEEKFVIGLYRKRCLRYINQN